MALDGGSHDGGGDQPVGGAPQSGQEGLAVASKERTGATRR